MPLRDEVNEPLGLWPEPEPRAARGAAPMIAILALPLMVAVAMAAFALGRHDVPPHTAQLALDAQPPPSAARVEAPAARAEPEPGARPPAPQASPEVTARAANPGAPTPLIIDVQQALAAQKAKADPFALR